MQWTDGMLYPLLHRLERLEYLSADWRTSDGGRRRKHYALTDSGRKALEERRQQWSVVSDALDQVWQRLATSPTDRGGLGHDVTPTPSSSPRSTSGAATSSATDRSPPPTSRRWKGTCAIGSPTSPRPA